jgi:hypothetical protein
MWAVRGNRVPSGSFALCAEGKLKVGASRLLKQLPRCVRRVKAYRQRWQCTTSREKARSEASTLVTGINRIAAAEASAGLEDKHADRRAEHHQRGDRDDHPTQYRAGLTIHKFAVAGRYQNTDQ